MMAGVFDVQGFGVLSDYNGALVTNAATSVMHDIAATGANSIELAPRIFMSTRTSTNVLDVKEKTESDANIATAIANAHAHGLSVLLKPMLSGLDGTVASSLSPSNAAAFFASYKAKMLDFAHVAQQAHADSLSIGNELSELTGSQYRSYWVDLIHAVRQVYQGPITYAAATDEAKHVSFWDQVNEIGINAYPPLTAKLNPTVDQMVHAWNSVPENPYWAAAMDYKSPVDFFHSLATEYGKQVLLTETGYRSVDGTNINPGNPSGNTSDAHAQADAFKAFFQVWSSEGGSWFKGAEIWQWDADNAVSPTGYSPMGKPAESLITDWFTGHDHAAPSTISGSPAADVIDSGSGNDSISGGLGNDTIWGGAGNDVIRGGPDAITKLADTTVTVTGFGPAVDGEGPKMNLLVNGQQVGSTVEFHNASDSTGYQTFTFKFQNPDKVSSLDLSFINDLANANGDRNLSVEGVTVNGKALDAADGSPNTWHLDSNGSIHYDMSGHQELFFGSSTDNDRINGGPGNDYLIGGAGSDTFVFAANFGKDVIADFQSAGTGHDLIQFDHTVFPNFQAVQSHMAQAGSNVVITADAHDTIQIDNTSKAHLNSGDFHFV
jgi:Ca2+-binding RTX toxin-like protein